MTTILAITAFFLIALVLVGLLAQRADRIRDEAAQGEESNPQQGVSAREKGGTIHASDGGT